MKERRAAPRVQLSIAASLSSQERAITSAGPVESVHAPAWAGPTAATIVDLSINGARLESDGEPPPLLARLDLRFTLPDYGIVDAVGLVMWRRSSHFILPPDHGRVVKALRPGFGMLFESIPLGARIVIDEMARDVVHSFRGEHKAR